MSVLNTMLRDLERRGELPAPSRPTGGAARIAAPELLQSTPDPRPRGWQARPALLLAAVAAAAAAVWLWPRPAPAPRPSAALVSVPQAAPGAPPSQALPVAPPLQTLPAAPPPQALPAAPPPQTLPPAEPPQAEAVAQPPVVEPAPTRPMRPHTPTPSPQETLVASVPHHAPAEAGPIAAPDTPAVTQSAAQSELTRAMELVARGRTTEAAQLLVSALSSRPSWNEARSALAALQAEGGDRRLALATLLDGVAFDPARFAPPAAHLQAELNDPAGALQTLDRVPAAARDQAYHALAAAIAQRADRHELAVREYGTALRLAPSDSIAWVGLGVSLQALGRDAQALAAYRGAEGAILGAELRRFVESRISVLRAATLTPAPLPRAEGK